MTDEDAVRELILRWAEAVHTGDLETVLADHDPDIVQFDAPPPSFAASTPTGSPGRNSSNGNARVPSSRSSSWT
jgi:hypothetical protein